MPHLWLHQNDRWEPAPLTGPALTLDPSGSLRADAGGSPAALRFRATANDGWVLLAPPRSKVRVNSRPLTTGIRVLRDRDEIVLGGVRSFFSTERLAGVEPFPGGAGGATVFCARCRQAIAKDDPAVRCPGCGTWCHQREDLGCWTYGEKCPLCDQSTALDAGYRWQPEF